MPDILHQAPDLWRQAMDLFAARPMTCVGALIAVLLYVNLMTSGPRIR
jgi:hypothetical protein